MASRSPSSPVRLAPLVHVLPREEEPHEVGGADRLDLRPEPVQRVAVNAREQRAIAPFRFCWIC